MTSKLVRENAERTERKETANWKERAGKGEYRMKRKWKYTNQPSHYTIGR